MDGDIIKVKDGADEIIYSQSFNIYENSLEITGIPGLPDRNFKFIFQTSEQKEGQNDLEVIWNEQNATITLAKKFRSTLGSGSLTKSKILQWEDGREVLFSIFGQQVGNNEMLNITISFYHRYGKK